MSVRPINDFVLVAREKAANVTEGGILLPEISEKQRRPWRGVVLAVGPGKLNEAAARTPLSVQPGDRVYFTQWTGHRFLSPPRDEQDELLVRADDILCTLERIGEFS